MGLIRKLIPHWRRRRTFTHDDHARKLYLRRWFYFTSELFGVFKGVIWPFQLIKRLEKHFAPISPVTRVTCPNPIISPTNKTVILFISTVIICLFRYIASQGELRDDSCKYRHWGTVGELVIVSVRCFRIGRSAGGFRPYLRVADRCVRK